MKRSIILLVVSFFILSGCADRDKAYQAIKEQNITMQLYSAQQEREREYRRDQREIKRQEHKERMAELATAMVVAVTATPDKTDDAMGPIMFAMMEDKWALAELIADAKEPVSSPPPLLQKIPMPADGVDYLKAGLPVIGGTVAAILGWKSYQTIADVATQAGGRYYLSDSATMHQNSDNTGSYNNTTSGGDTTISAHTGNNNPEPVEEVEMCTGSRGSVPFTDGLFVGSGCSCSSYQNNECNI